MCRSWISAKTIFPDYIPSFLWLACSGVFNYGWNLTLQNSGFPRLDLRNLDLYCMCTVLQIPVVRTVHFCINLDLLRNTNYCLRILIITNFTDFHQPNLTKFNKDNITNKPLNEGLLHSDTVIYHLVQLIWKLHSLVKSDHKICLWNENKNLQY